MLHWIYWILYYFPLLHIPPVFGFEKGKCQGERMRANGWSARAHREWTKRAEQDAWWINIINMSPVNYIIVCHSKNFHSVYVCVCLWCVCLRLCSCQMSLWADVFSSRCLCVLKTWRFRDCIHVITNRKDREVETGGVGEIINRSQSVTHRLLSANTEEDQTSPCSETPHDNSLSLTNNLQQSVCMSCNGT